MKTVIRSTSLVFFHLNKWSSLSLCPYVMWSRPCQLALFTFSSEIFSIKKKKSFFVFSSIFFWSHNLKMFLIQLFYSICLIARVLSHTGLTSPPFFFLILLSLAHIKHFKSSSFPPWKTHWQKDIDAFSHYWVAVHLYNRSCIAFGQSDKATWY